MENKQLNYYRIKTEFVAECQDGSLKRQKIEELVLATSYTEAEMLTNGLIASLNRTRFGSASYEIIKTKITDVLYNDILETDEPLMGFVFNYFKEEDISGVGLYAVKVIFSSIDERTAKEKQKTEVFYVPAESNADATKRIAQYIGDTSTDFVIRDTKFDKAEAIYWPLDVHNDKIKNYEIQ